MSKQKSDVCLFSGIISEFVVYNLYWRISCINVSGFDKWNRFFQNFSDFTRSKIVSKLYWIDKMSSYGNKSADQRIYLKNQNSFNLLYIIVVTFTDNQSWLICWVAIITPQQTLAWSYTLKVNNPCLYCSLDFQTTYGNLLPVWNMYWKR